MRSAMFSIGVLKGLADAQILDSVEVISAVSGGSYAASALYAQHKHLSKTGPVRTLRDVLSDRYLRHLEQNGNLFVATEAYLAPYSLIRGAPYDWYFNGWHGHHLNTSTMAEVYRWRLKKLFHVDLRNREESAQTDLYLSDFSPSDGLPFLIINGTAQFRFAGTEPTLAQRVFEFTPIAYGSDGLGRYSLDEVTLKRRGDTSTKFLFKEFSFGQIPSLSLAVAISGAAVDPTALLSGHFARNLISALNLDLGRFLRNPSVSESEWQSYKRLIFPFYWFHELHGWNAESGQFYVTDGGHSENLAAYSLIRRHCGHIIIVDGEHDPTYEFKAYQKLRSELKAEYQSSDEILVVCDIDKMLQEREEAVDEKSSIREHRNRIAAKSSMQGDVVFPNGERLKVTYIKLAYPDATECPDIHELSDALGACNIDADPDLFENSSIAKQGHWDIRSYYYCEEERRIAESVLGLIRTSFPQEGTADLSYSAAQVRAYNQLGYQIGTKIKLSKNPLELRSLARSAAKVH